MRTLFSIAVITIIASFAFPSKSEAVLPPDILFSIGSQATQIIALIGVALMGTFGAVIAWMRLGFGFFRSRAGLMFVGMTLCIFAIIYGAVMAQPTRATLPQPTTTVDGHRRYEALRIIAVGKDVTNPVVLELDLNSRERSDGTFDHYYYGELIEKTVASSAYSQHVSADIHIEPYAYLENIVRTPSPDLSTRESYAVTAKIDDTEVALQTGELRGDFITKNTPEYIKYNSVGTGTVIVNGRESEVFVFVAPVFSSDFSSSIFTPDYYTVGGSAKQFILWDAQGNFYLADESTIEHPTSAYPSHFWTLSKNATTQATYKGFSGVITSNATILKNESLWHIAVPTYPQFSADVQRITSYNGNLRGMFVRGTVTNDTGETVPAWGTGYVQSL